MERTLLAVENDGFGWHVLVRGKCIDQYGSRSEAMDAAVGFARLRHDATGEPTGVKMAMGEDEDVLLELHG